MGVPTRVAVVVENGLTHQQKDARRAVLAVIMHVYEAMSATNGSRRMRAISAVHAVIMEKIIAQ